jgi:anti-sigma regulatory factor (Ser/Thr protein kinase)
VRHETPIQGLKATAGQSQPTPIRLRLSSDKARLLIEVSDADPRPPMLKDLGADGKPALEDEGGRGLFLVEALSERWSWYASREWGGKLVWCEIQALLQ